MDDASTAEVCRAMLWFWIKNKVPIFDLEFKAKEGVFQTYLKKEVKRMKDMAVN
jgi:malate synthase